MANKIADFLGNVTRRGFLNGAAVVVASMSCVSVATAEISLSAALAEMPTFIRELVATEIGVTTETINEWIDSGDEESQELICNAVCTLDERVKILQEQRRVGAS